MPLRLSSHFNVAEIKNSLLMIIYELNNIDWLIKTWYCNKQRTKKQFRHFSRKMVKAQLLMFFKTTEGMIFLE